MAKLATASLLIVEARSTSAPAVSPARALEPLRVVGLRLSYDWLNRLPEVTVRFNS